METEIAMEKGTVSRMRKRARSPQAKRKKTEADIAIDEAIGERIRQVRVEIADLDQRSFAMRLGVSPPAVAQWELGKGCQRANLDKIVAEFGISRDWLHTGVGSPRLSRIVSEMHLLSPDRLHAVAEFVAFQAAQQALKDQEQEETQARKAGQ